jgi:hypothetical protein
VIFPHCRLIRRKAEGRLTDPIGSSMSPLL